MPDINALNFRFGGDGIHMAKKEFDGKVLRAEGSAATASTICSITPASGKTFYFMGGHWAASSSNANCTAELQNNGAIRETVRGSTGTTTTSHTENGRWETRGDSLDGTGSLVYRVQYISGTSTMEASIFGFIEDDANDPSVAI